jgi:hypothetical protein
VRGCASAPSLAASIVVRDHVVLSHIVADDLGDSAMAWIDPSGDSERRPVSARLWIGETDCEATMLCCVSACLGDAIAVYAEKPAPDADPPLY